MTRFKAIIGWKSRRRFIFTAGDYRCVLSAPSREVVVKQLKAHLPAWFYIARGHEELRPGVETGKPVMDALEREMRALGLWCGKCREPWRHCGCTKQLLPDGSISPDTAPLREASDG